MVARHERRGKKRSSGPGKKIAVCLVVLALFVGAFVWHSYPVKITVDGKEYSISHNATLQNVVDKGKCDAPRGDYVAVDGSILKEGKGESPRLFIEGEEVDYSAKVEKGQEYTSAKGNDIIEEYEYTSEPIPYEMVIEGNIYDPVGYVMNPGREGELQHRVGHETGIVCDAVAVEPEDTYIKYFSCDTGDRKVIALTFDDGPWPEYTEQILDILKENNAKATFFSVGNCQERYPDLVEREAAEGHQVSTHTYDHCPGVTNFSLTNMPEDKALEEITKGIDVIETLTGARNTTFRAPGGSFNSREWSLSKDTITSLVKWNVDTLDWSRPGKDRIVSAIESAKPGDIILCHDGGGDRSQTVEAIKEAIPYMISQGYEFVTVDELLEIHFANEQ